jgi:hypothetical protein
MLARHKILFFIPVVILIPIILGMTPLNMAHKLASGEPFTHCKQVQWSNYCPFHSIASYDNPIIVNLNSTPVAQESTPAFDIEVLDLDFIQSNITFNSVPLRC